MWSDPREASSDPVPVEGTRPLFAGVIFVLPGHTAPLASTRPAPAPAWAASTLFVLTAFMAVWIRVAFARSGVRLGFVSYISAAIPETMAAACDVPVPLK